jgi:integral membrane protein
MTSQLKSDHPVTKRFLIAGIIEGWSYLLLFFVAMPLKYFAEMPEYVKIVGMIHGVLVVLYIILLIQMHVQVKLSLKNSLYAFLLSLIPFGTFFLKRVIH